MSKNNKPQQRQVFTRPVVDTICKDDYQPETTEQWLITHESKQQVRPPHTEIINGSLAQWLNENKEKVYIIHSNRIK